MRPHPAAPVLVLLALAACNGDGATAASATPPTLARSVAAPVRPLAGECETVLAPTEFVRPGVVRQVDTGVCRLSHLGRTTFYSDKLIDLVAGTQTTRATFTAANGDVLRATGSGTNAITGPGRAVYTATLVLAGGSGRFAAATGEARVNGKADLVARTSALTLEGELAYAASDRGEP